MIDTQFPLFTKRDGTLVSLGLSGGAITLCFDRTDRVATYAISWTKKGKLRWPADVFCVVDHRARTGWITENGELVYSF